MEKNRREMERQKNVMGKGVRERQGCKVGRLLGRIKHMNAIRADPRIPRVRRPPN